MNRTFVSLILASAVVATVVVTPVIGHGVASQSMADRSTYELGISGMTVGDDGELCVEKVNDDVVRVSGNDLTFDDLDITLVGGTENATTVGASEVHVPEGEHINIYSTDGNMLIDALSEIEGFTGIGCIPGLEIVDLPLPFPLDMEVYKIESSVQELSNLQLGME